MFGHPVDPLADFDNFLKQVKDLAGLYREISQSFRRKDADEKKLATEIESLGVAAQKLKEKHEKLLDANGKIRAKNSQVEKDILAIGEAFEELQKRFMKLLEKYVAIMQEPRGKVTFIRFI